MPARGPSLITVTEGVMAIVVLVLVLYIVTLYFIGSLRKTMRKVPRSMQTVPAELIWLLLVPGVEYVIAWVMLPFSIPRSIHKALHEQGSKAQAKAVGLSRAGLSLCIFGLLFLGTFVWIFALSHQNFSAKSVSQHSIVASVLFIVFAVAQLLSFVVYWKKAVSIRPDLDASWERRFTKTPVDAKPRTE